MAELHSLMAVGYTFKCSEEGHRSFKDSMLKLCSQGEAPSTVEVHFNPKKGLTIVIKGFSDGNLSEGFCHAVGDLLSAVGKDYLEFACYQFSPDMKSMSHVVDLFRIYMNGDFVKPEIVRSKNSHMFSTDWPSAPRF